MTYDEGIEAALDAYGVKIADALSRAVQRGAVEPSIENAQRLRAQMPGSRWGRAPAPGVEQLQKTLGRMQNPALTPQGQSALQRMRGKLRESDFDPARVGRLEAIQAKSVEPRMKELGDVYDARESYALINTGGPVKRVTPEMKRQFLVAKAKGDTRSLVSKLRWEALKSTGHDIGLESGPGYIRRPSLEHEAGERWLLERAARGKPVTPYASHMGPEATSREWNAAAHNPRGWTEAANIRRDSFGITDSSFPRIYTAAGGTQGSPIAPDSRRERALGRAYDHLLSQGPYIGEGTRGEVLEILRRTGDSRKVPPGNIHAAMLLPARNAALGGARLTPGLESALAHPSAQHLFTQQLPQDVPSIESTPRDVWAKFRRRLTS